MFRPFRPLLLALGLTLVSGLAFAGPATDTLKAKQTALFELVKKSSPENARKANAVFDELLDYPALTEASLGNEWANRSDAEKKEFGDLLKLLVRKSYEKNLKKVVNYDVEYITEDGGDGRMVVKTKAKSKTDAREDPLELNYKMAEKDGVWRIQDFITEGVSLVGSYRNQFTRIIKKDGFPKLIQKMKDKLAKGDV